MTRDELNAAISKLLTPEGYWDKHCRSCGWTFTEHTDDEFHGCTPEVCSMVYEGPRPNRADAPTDWHDDSRWPILMQELPRPCSLEMHTGLIRVAFPDLGIIGGGWSDETPAAAVCHAWWYCAISPKSPSFYHQKNSVRQEDPCKNT